MDNFSRFIEKFTPSDCDKLRGQCNSISTSVMCLLYYSNINVYYFSIFINAVFLTWWLLLLVRWKYMVSLIWKALSFFTSSAYVFYRIVGTKLVVLEDVLKSLKSSTYSVKFSTISYVFGIPWCILINKSLTVLLGVWIIVLQLENLENIRTVKK